MIYVFVIETMNEPSMEKVYSSCIVQTYSSTLENVYNMA